MALALGPIIARRELGLHGCRAPVIVEIGTPREEPDGNWLCPYRVRGVGRSTVRRAFGADSMQALQLAFAAIRADLSTKRDALTWFDAEPGLLGFPEFVPYSFGRAVERRLERRLAALVRTETRALTRRAKAKATRRARSKRAH